MLVISTVFPPLVDWFLALVVCSFGCTLYAFATRDLTGAKGGVVFTVVAAVLWGLVAAQSGHLVAGAG